MTPASPAKSASRLTAQALHDKLDVITRPDMPIHLDRDNNRLCIFDLPKLDGAPLDDELYDFLLAAALDELRDMGVILEQSVDGSIMGAMGNRHTRFKCYNARNRVFVIYPQALLDLTLTYLRHRKLHALLAP